MCLTTILGTNFCHALQLANCRYSLSSFYKDIKLYPIDKGFDSVQLRVWFETDFFEDSLYHCLIISKHKDKPWKAIRLDFRFPIVGGEQRINEKLEFLKVTDVSELCNSTSFKSLEYQPFSRNYDEAIESCRIGDFYSSKYIIIEYANAATYHLSSFWSPVSLNDSCRASLTTDLESFLKAIRSDFELEFIDNFFSGRGIGQN